MRKTETRVAPASPLKLFLDVCDRLGAIGSRLGDSPSEALERRLTRRRSESRARLARLVARGSPSLSTTISALRRRHRLSPQEVLATLLLLHKRIARGNVFVPARDVLETLFDTSFDILRGLHLLAPDAPLRRHGVVVTARESVAPEEILDLEVKLADEVFGMVCGEIGGAGTAGPQPAEGCYSASLDYLMDLRRLALAYQKRAARVFAAVGVDDLSTETEEPLHAIETEIASLGREIRGRLRRTTAAENFAIVRFVREHGLRGLEEILVVTLLFQELLTGAAALPAATLLKIVSSSERDLFRKRALLLPESRLVASGIVAFEEPFAEKPLTAQVYLPHDIVERVLSDVAGGALPGDADLRISFHRYLDGLEGSDDVFDKLA